MGGMVDVREGRLSQDGVEVDPRRVIGFHERYDRLDGYGPLRKAVREAFPDRPFTSDWADGVFPAAPLGLPAEVAFAVGAVLTTLLASVSTAFLGPLAGLGVAVALGWPVVRLRDALVVRREGLGVGPPWASIVPWHEVTSVTAERVGRRVIVRVVTASGAGEATIPAVLLPAARARIGRMGGLSVGPPSDPVDWRYALWRAPAIGIPWGALLGGLAVAPWLDRPWRIVAVALLVASATALLGAGVSARANGWGTGGVIALTAVYAVVLAAIGLALGGW
jgi:hypothetical protein